MLNIKKITLLAILMCVSACHSLPDLAQRTPSIYIPTQKSPRLEQVFRLPESQSHPKNHAAIYVLDNAQDAFLARQKLAENANVSLDLRYYIWKNDISGRILFQNILEAANRGVRVRLLLDDNNTRGMDAILSVLNQHNNIEIRLFNPFLHRSWRALGYLSDFPRVNRRMHNKSFTADNRVSIIGGRNIGDAYFSNQAETVFADMDVMVSGSVVNEISADFDRYWQSESAYPFEMIVKKTSPQKQIQAHKQLHDTSDPKQNAFIASLQDTPLNLAIKNKKINYLFAPTDLLSDDPAKALDRKTQTDILASLNAALQEPQNEIYLVSPYFVPTKMGAKILKNWSQEGKKITILTNSLRATDVAAVHSGYVKYRKPLLKSGVQIFEFKPDYAMPKQKDKGLTGSSSASLHAKTFVADRQRVFVGSLNLDPRSARLNTEMGVVIHSPKLANAMQTELETQTQHTAYRVSLNKNNRLQWQDPQTGEISKHEPEASWFKRTISKILSVLPIERLL